MIRLEKREVPEAIRTKLADRTQRYLALLAAGDTVPESLLNAYRDREVKLLLRAETSDKCAYCESKVPHVGHGDVEHMLPKAVRPDLRFDYNNLTYACAVCNGHKGDFYNAEAQLLHPYEDEPGEHLFALGSMVMRVPTSDRGFVTQRRLQLNRGALVERRTERLEAVGALMDQIARATNPAVRSVLEDQVRQECAEDKEYTMVVRSYVKSVGEFLAI